MGACFKQAKGGNPLSPSLQLQVFENWYGKDLERDAGQVWGRFYAGSALLGLVGVLFYRWRQQQFYPRWPPPQQGAWGWNNPGMRPPHCNVGPSPYGGNPRPFW